MTVSRQSLTDRIRRTTSTVSIKEGSPKYLATASNKAASRIIYMALPKEGASIEVGITGRKGWLGTLKQCDVMASWVVDRSVEPPLVYLVHQNQNDSYAGEFAEGSDPQTPYSINSPEGITVMERMGALLDQFEPRKVERSSQPITIPTPGTMAHIQG